MALRVIVITSEKLDRCADQHARQAKLIEQLVNAGGPLYVFEPEIRLSETQFESGKALAAKNAAT